MGAVITLAGGFRPEADYRRVQIERIVPPADRTAPGADRRVFDVESDMMVRSPELLVDGDIKPSIAVSIDGEIATGGVLDSLREDSEVHFIPALGGGNL